MAFGTHHFKQTEVEKVEAVTDFLFLGSKITADSRHETKKKKKKKCLLPGRKAVTNIDSLLKSRNITLLTKEHMIKSMVFPVVIYGCKNWTIKKADCRRIDAFKLQGRRRILRVPWTIRRTNKLILKEINPEYSLEGVILKLKLQYFGHLMGRADSLEKTRMLGKIEGKKRRVQQRIRW